MTLARQVVAPAPPTRHAHVLRRQPAESLVADPATVPTRITLRGAVRPKHLTGAVVWPDSELAVVTPTEMYVRVI